MERPLLRAPEVAQMLGLSKAKVYELMASGDLPTKRIGRSVRVVASKLEAWIEGSEDRPTQGERQADSRPSAPTRPKRAGGRRRSPNTPKQKKRAA